MVDVASFALLLLLLLLPLSEVKCFDYVFLLSLSRMSKRERGGASRSIAKSCSKAPRPQKPFSAAQDMYPTSDPEEGMARMQKHTFGDTDDDDDNSESEQQQQQQQRQKISAPAAKKRKTLTHPSSSNIAKAITQTQKARKRRPPPPPVESSSDSDNDFEPEQSTVAVVVADDGDSDENAPEMECAQELFEEAPIVVEDSEIGINDETTLTELWDMYGSGEKPEDPFVLLKALVAKWAATCIPKAFEDIDFDSTLHCVTNLFAYMLMCNEKLSCPIDPIFNLWHHQMYPNIALTDSGKVRCYHGAPMLVKPLVYKVNNENPDAPKAVKARDAGGVPIVCNGTAYLQVSVKHKACCKYDEGHTDWRVRYSASSCGMSVWNTLEFLTAVNFEKHRWYASGNFSPQVRLAKMQNTLVVPVGCFCSFEGLTRGAPLSGAQLPQISSRPIDGAGTLTEEDIAADPGKEVYKAFPFQLCHTCPNKTFVKQGSSFAKRTFPSCNFSLKGEDIRKIMKMTKACYLHHMCPQICPPIALPDLKWSPLFNNRPYVLNAGNPHKVLDEVPMSSSDTPFW